MHQIKRKNRLASHIISALCAFLLSCIAGFAAGHWMGDAVPSYCYKDLEAPAGSSSILDEVEMDTENSRIEGLHVYAERYDAELFLTFEKGKARYVRTVILRLKESFLHEAACTLYYPTPSGDYEEACKDTFTLPKGEKVIYFEIPEHADYKMPELRVDIDEDYIIEDILVSENEIGAAYKLQNRTWPAVVYFFAVFFICELLFFFGSVLKSFFADCLEKRRKAAALALMLLGSAVLGNAAAFLLFRIAGKDYSWFWAVLIGLCSAAACFQMYLLFRKDILLPKKETRRTTAALFWTVIIVFSLLIVFEWMDAVKNVPKLRGIIRFQFPFLFAVAETVLLALLFRKYILNVCEDGISFLNAYLFIFFMIGLAYMLVFLPYVSPDEPSHYVSAYRISNMLLGKFSQWGEGRLLMRMEDYQFFDRRGLVLNADYYMQITEHFRLFAGETGYAAVDAPMVTNAVFSYFVTGTGIAAARLLHLSAQMTFYAGRLANLVFFLLVLRHLMKKIPFGRTALFAIAMMPMTLHMAASYSYDVTIFCFVALFVMQVMCMICCPQKITGRDYFLCILYGILMAPCKLVYIPLLFLVLLVPGEKMGDSRREAWRKKLLVIGCGLASALVVTFAVSCLNADSTIRQMMDGDTAANVLTWIDEPGYTIAWILGHMGEYLLMTVRTVITMADYYFFTMIGGLLGWLDVSIPYVYTVISFAMFFLAVNIQDAASAKIQISVGKKIWILILYAGSAFATILVMAVSWTPASYNYVVGVQGRYFVPLLLPIIWLFRNNIIRVDSVIRKHIVFFTALLNIWILVYVFAQNIMRV